MTRLEKRLLFNVLVAILDLLMEQLYPKYEGRAASNALLVRDDVIEYSERELK